MLLIDETLGGNKRPLLDYVRKKVSFVGDPLRLAFLDTLSQKIIGNPSAKVFADLSTFAFFCRKRNLCQSVKEIKNSNLKSGWGWVIHIAPSNVAMNFAYSFLFGFLSGNTNIVRLPSRHWPQVDILINLFDQVLGYEEFADLRDTFIFIRTEHDSPWLKAAIRKCDGLMVWGGDETVETFRSVSKIPRCVEMYFPNRKSILFLNATEFNALSTKQKRNLAERFYNDTYIVDHNACSSPQTIYWIGFKQEIESARSVFWNEIIAVNKIKNFILDPVARIDRYLDVMGQVVNTGKSFVLDQWALDIWTQNNSKPDQIFRLGRFNEIYADELATAIEHLPRGVQTLTYFGFQKETLYGYCTKVMSLPDRVVPVGRALDIGFIWDGVNVLERFSKYTSLR